MKKYRLGILKISVLILLVTYVLLCVFLMEIPPFDTILPFGLIAVLILMFIAVFIGFFGWQKTI